MAISFHRFSFPDPTAYALAFHARRKTVSCEAGLRNGDGLAAGPRASRPASSSSSAAPLRTSTRTVSPLPRLCGASSHAAAQRRAGRNRLAAEPRPATSSDRSGERCRTGKAPARFQPELRRRRSARPRLQFLERRPRVSPSPVTFTRGPDREAAAAGVRTHPLQIRASRGWRQAGERKLQFALAGPGSRLNSRISMRASGSAGAWPRSIGRGLRARGRRARNRSSVSGADALQRARQAAQFRHAKDAPDAGRAAPSAQRRVRRAADASAGKARGRDRRASDAVGAPGSPARQRGQRECGQRRHRCEVVDLLVHLVGGLDHLGVGLVAALRHDQVDELFAPRDTLDCSV